MAADKKDVKKAAPAAPAAAGDAGDAQQKKKKLLILIGVGVLLVLISVGATIGALKILSPQTKSDPAADSSSSEHSIAGKPAIYYALKPSFTVNYDVNGRQRFLQTELTFTYRDEALLKTLELHMPAVRNSLVLLLSNQVFDELQTTEGKEKLRAEALEAVQEILDKEQSDALARLPAKEREKFEKEHGHGDLPNIEQVLFTNFVMQ